MLKEEKLPKDLVEGEHDVRVLTIPGLVSMSAIIEGGRTGIVKHGHEENQWEVYIDLKLNTVYICRKGKKHEHYNFSEEEKKLLAIKGLNTTESELKWFFEYLGMKAVIM